MDMSLGWAGPADTLGVCRQLYVHMNSVPCEEAGKAKTRQPWEWENKEELRMSWTCGSPLWSAYLKLAPVQSG